MVFYLFIIVALVSLDQVIKYLVRLFLDANSYIELIPNLIHLTYQENKGISFSLMSELPESFRVPVLAGVSALVVLGLLIYIYRHWEKLSRWERWGFTLIISGALGNLIDRAFRQQVTDYMHFHFFNTGFFVNNLADDLISIGFVILLFHAFLKKDKKNE